MTDEVNEHDERWIRLIEGRASRLEQAEAQRDRLAAAARDFLEDTEHVVDIREDGWAIQHPPLCRPSMLDCDWTKRATKWDLPPAPVGKWVLPLVGAIIQRWDGADKLEALRAALADVPERCDHVEHVPGGGDVRCSEPAGHEKGAHMGMIRDVLAATDVPDARRKDEALRACVEALVYVSRTGELDVSQSMVDRALALARQVEE